MKGKRTGIDFSEHEVVETKVDGLLVHHIRIPGTSSQNIKFINTNGILAVTGDYGNWIFCREFHPGGEGVCEYYWTQKLRNSSSQEPGEWDTDKTKAALKRAIKETDRRDEPELVKYYIGCIRNLDEGEEFYKQWAFEKLPDGYDYESIISIESIKFWLQAVYDGFDEICRRMKETASTNLQNATPKA